MKKIGLTVATALLMISCTTNTSTNNTVAQNSTLDTINKVAQISTAISQISDLLGGLNLTDSQSSLLKNALVSYVKDYSGLNNQNSNYGSLLNGLKTNTLNEIKTGLGTSKYNEVFSTIKAFTADKDVEKINNNTSTNELVTQALISLIN